MAYKLLDKRSNQQPLTYTGGTNHSEGHSLTPLRLFFNSFAAMAQQRRRLFLQQPRRYTERAAFVKSKGPRNWGGSWFEAVLA